MKTPHKHAVLIKAWADGADIQYRKQGKYWVTDDEMGWYEDYQYRIKPEPKPDVVEKYKVDAGLKYGCVRIAGHWEQDNLKLTFDGETGKLKAAEVI